MQSITIPDLNPCEECGADPVWSIGTWGEGYFMTIGCYESDDCCESHVENKKLQSLINFGVNTWNKINPKGASHV